MKKVFSAACALVFAISGLSAQAPELKTPRDSASYAFGILIGNSLSRQISSDLSLDIVLKAMTDQLKGKNDCQRTAIRGAEKRLRHGIAKGNR